MDPWTAWMLGLGPVPPSPNRPDLTKGPEPIKWGRADLPIESGELDLSQGIAATPTAPATPTTPASGYDPAQYTNMEEFKRLAESAGSGAASPSGAPIAKVTIDGKTYDYSRGSMDRAPMLTEPAAYPGYETEGLDLSREVVSPPGLFPGGGPGMPPSTITATGMEESARQGGRGVSMMPGTDEQRAALEMEGLQRETGLAEQQARLMRARMAGPAVPGAPAPRTYEDVKRDEQRQRLTGIEGQIRSRFDPTNPEGAQRRKSVAAKVAAQIQTTNPSLWAKMTPEQRAAEIDAGVTEQVEAIMRSEFERAIVIESILSGSASPTAQYLRPRPFGTEQPTYYTY